MNISDIFKKPIAKAAQKNEFTPLSDFYNVKEPIKPKIDIPKFLAAIRSNETSIVPGNPYLSKQFSGVPALGNAIGAYRITEEDFRLKKNRYLPKGTTLAQFQNSPALQDMYMTNQAIAREKEGYTPQQMADFHNKGTGILLTTAGEKHKPGSVVYQNPDYVNKFNINYNK